MLHPPHSAFLQDPCFPGLNFRTVPPMPACCWLHQILGWDGRHPALLLASQEAHWPPLEAHTTDWSGRESCRRAQGARMPWTGRACWSACTPAGLSAWGTRCPPWTGWRVCTRLACSTADLLLLPPPLAGSQRLLTRLHCSHHPARITMFMAPVLTCLPACASKDAPCSRHLDRLCQVKRGASSRWRYRSMGATRTGTLQGRRARTVSCACHPSPRALHGTPALRLWRSCQFSVSMIGMQTRLGCTVRAAQPERPTCLVCKDAQKSVTGSGTLAF